MNKVYANCMYQSDFDRLDDELARMVATCKVMLGQQKTILGKWELNGYLNILKKAKKSLEHHHERSRSGKHE